MKIAKITGAGTAFLFLGALTVLYAQHDDKQGGKDDVKQGDKHDKSKGKQDKGAAPGHAPQARQGPERPQQPVRRQEPASQQPPQRAQQAQQQQPRVQQQPRSEPIREQPQRSEQQARAWQQQRGWAQKGGGWTGNENWQRGRAQRWSTEHRSWTQRGGYGGYYVPQDRFNLYFGNQHMFRLGARPVMYQGYPRFEYSDTSFLLVDPYPEYWADNWYDLDDVYIDYDDGYYLYNRAYPQVRLAITIVL